MSPVLEVESCTYMDADGRAELSDFEFASFDIAADLTG
jgi:hypothetical protein